MRGFEDQYRIRVGDYRVIYEIHDDVLLVLVVRVGNSRDVYRTPPMKPAPPSPPEA